MSVDGGVGIFIDVSEDEPDWRLGFVVTILLSWKSVQPVTYWPILGPLDS